MSIDPIHKVPAGKRIPGGKKKYPLKRFYRRIFDLFKTRKVRKEFFIIASALMITLILGTHVYLNNFVYVVLMDDHEVGVVKDPREMEYFIADLTDKCTELYGMQTEPGEKIAVVKEYKPGSKPETEAVQNYIRQRMSLTTEAYMVTIEGEPFIPLCSEESLEELINEVKLAYTNHDSSVKMLDAYIVENIELLSCRVSPDEVYSAQEAAELLLNGGNHLQARASAIPDNSVRSSLDSRSSLRSDISGSGSASEVNLQSDSVAAETTGNSNVSALHVKTIEELVVVEAIPYEIDIVHDDELWVVQEEIDTPGEEGEKEITYQVTRENGKEIGRTKVSEKVIAPSVTQVERHGTAQVPSVGSGQFIWPVAGGGVVTPGRGFSSWHTGIDIAADTGTNVLAADNGVVWFSGYGGSQGNYIIIYHGNYWTLYLHNNTNHVKKGDKVDRGEVIAKLGSTGRSSGPHLHFEIRMDDGSGEWHAYYQHKPLDPLRFFKP